MRLLKRGVGVRVHLKGAKRGAKEVQELLKGCEKKNFASCALEVRTTFKYAPSRTSTQNIRYCFVIKAF